jgi:serine/threonine protein kinase
MPDKLIGLVVNSRYQIVQKLGSGGLGAVYAARDLALGREVAIKVIKPDALWTAPDAPDLFLKEAKIIAALDHPNIVTIHDVIRQDDPEYPLFLVTKFAKGGSLHSYLHPANSIPRPLSSREAEKFLTQIAAALDYAHNQKVIHLDIKPSNILFADTTGQTVLVADFGLARLLETTTHVQISGGSGTRDYMPQEQLAGGDVGRYSDVYALGITLYEMLTGETPKKSFEGSGFVAQLTRPLSPKVRQVIERATQLDPRQRYQSAGELASAFKDAWRDDRDRRPSSPSPSAYAGPVPGSGPVAPATVYPNLAPVSSAPSYPPYPVYTPRPSYPPIPPSGLPLPVSGQIWSPVSLMKPVNLKAKISLWLGILTLLVGMVVVSEFYAAKSAGAVGGIISCGAAAWLGIVAVVLGHLAKREIRLSNNQIKGKVRASVGLIFGYFNIFFFGISLLALYT